MSLDILNNLWDNFTVEHLIEEEKNTYFQWITEILE